MNRSTMESVTSSRSTPCRASNYDEFSMQQSMQFSDSLKDLKSLKKQLYSAADYFESSFRKHEEKQAVVRTVKDYTLKAFINTVDHLGSMTYKVNCLMNEKSQEFSTIELPVSCFEQRLQACQQFINHGGLSRQSFMINTPKHHTRYILPEEMNTGSRVESKFVITGADTEIDRNDPQATSRETTSTSFMKNGQHSEAQIPQSVATGTFSFTDASPNRKPEKREASPFRFQLTRSGSLVNRSTSPNPANNKTKRRYPSEPRRSISPSVRSGTEKRNDLELYASKNKRMFKALLGMRKSKKDAALYKYLDEH